MKRNFYNANIRIPSYVICKGKTKLKKQCKKKIKFINDFCSIHKNQEDKGIYGGTIHY